MSSLLSSRLMWWKSPEVTDGDARRAAAAVEKTLAAGGAEEMSERVLGIRIGIRAAALYAEECAAGMLSDAYRGCYISFAPKLLEVMLPRAELLAATPETPWLSQSG